MKNYNYQLFILLAEILKIAPDMQYSYGFNFGSTKYDYLQFFGSPNRDKNLSLDDSIIVSAYKQNGDLLRVSDFHEFTYEVFLATKDLKYNLYNEKNDFRELEKENVSLEDILCIIKEKFLKNSIDEKLLYDKHKLGEFINRNNIEVYELNNKNNDYYIGLGDFVRYFDLTDITLENIIKLKQNIKYFIYLNDFENLLYNKVSFNEFKKFFGSFNKIYDSKKIIEVINTSEKIKKLYKYNRENIVLIEIENDKN